MSILRAMIERLPKGAQIKIEKRAARSLVWMSAAKGALTLRGRPPPRILIDNSVLWHGLTHTNAWISTGTVMWGGKVPVETGHPARVPVSYAAHNRKIYEQEVPFFAPLAKLAIDRKILLFTSEELLNERLRHGSYNSSRLGMNLWWKAPIERLPDLARSKFSSSFIGPTELREHWSKEGQTRRVLATADATFQQLATGIPIDNVLDLYHLWTAKSSGCSIFLTTDFAFQRFFDNNLARSTRDFFSGVKIMKPSTFGKELGLAPIPYHCLTPLDSNGPYEMFIPDVVHKQRQ